MEFRHHHHFLTASARSFHNRRYDILGKTCEKEYRNGLRGWRERVSVPTGKRKGLRNRRQRAGIDVANVIGVCVSSLGGGGHSAVSLSACVVLEAVAKADVPLDASRKAAV